MAESPHDGHPMMDPTQPPALQETEIPFSLSDSDPDIDRALLDISSAALTETLGTTSTEGHLDSAEYQASVDVAFHAEAASAAPTTTTADTVPAVSMALGFSEPSYVTAGNPSVNAHAGGHTVQQNELVDFGTFPDLSGTEPCPLDEMSVTALSGPNGLLGVHPLQNPHGQGLALRHAQQNMQMPMMSEPMQDAIPQDAIFAPSEMMPFGLPLHQAQAVQATPPPVEATTGIHQSQWQAPGIVPSARSETGLRRVSGWTGGSRIVKRRRGSGGDGVQIEDDESTWCHVCDTDCLTKGAKKNHMRKFHPKPKVYACHDPSCNTRFSAKCNLSKHYRSVHMKVRPYRCQNCTSTFSERNKLIKHQDTVHGGARPFSCTEPGCQKMFGQKSDRTRHIAVVHLGHRRYKCGDCAKAFGRKSSLAQHVMRIHKQTKDQAAEVMAAAIGMDPESTDGITVYPARIIAMAGGA